MDRTTRPLKDLKNWVNNPRTIDKQDFERLKRQIERLGQYKPLIVTSDGIVLGGNMRLRAYKELGMTEAWVSIVEAPTEARKIEFALSDNDRAGEYDEEKLTELIATTPDVNLTALRDYKVDLGKMTDLDMLLSKYGPSESENEPPELCPNCGQKMPKDKHAKKD